MFDELPKANREASTPFHLWLQQGYTEIHNEYFHLSVIRKLIASWSHTSWRTSQWSIITRWVHLNVCPNSLTLQTNLIFWDFFICLRSRSPWFDQVAERVEHRSRGVLIRTRFQHSVSLSPATKYLLMSRLAESLFHKLDSTRIWVIIQLSSWQKQICHSEQS